MSSHSTPLFCLMQLLIKYILLSLCRNRSEKRLLQCTMPTSIMFQSNSFTLMSRTHCSIDILALSPIGM